MNIFYKSVFMILVWVSSSVFAAEDLKSYYEKQKAEIAPAFVAPSLGSEVRLKLSGGQVRSGILMKLSASSISVMTDSGMVDYKRSVLHESSRADFFVEDFAHVKAIEKTQEYKKQLYMTEAAKQAANIHEGSLSVSAKIDKSSNKEVEEEDRENTNTGSTIRRTTTTRTYADTQILHITISNKATHPDTYTLAWYFFGQAIENDSISVHDNGSRQVVVAGRQRALEKVSSKPFEIIKTESTTTNLNSSFNNDARISESGKENAGWLVVLKYGEEILDMKASSKTFLTDEWLNKVN